MRKGALATLAAFVALALPSAAHAVDPRNEIVVFGPDTQRLTGFKKLDCKVIRNGGKLLAKGKSREGWRLEVHINEFDGFGEEYDIAYGINATNFAIYPTSSNSLYYSNLFFPGEQPPPFGGAAALSGNGKDLGLGFVSAFSSKSDDAEDGVVVAGHAKCKYPKKRKG